MPELANAADTSAQALEVARHIGRRLANEAFWSDGWCNWLGAQSRDFRFPSAGDTHRSLDRWLYDGCAGVAIFLADLHAVTGDAAVRRCALGAMARALARDKQAPAPGHLGLYAGWPGVAVAAARVSEVLNEPALLDQARQLAEETLVAHGAEGPEFDLIAGHAGDLLAALCLFRRLGDPALLATAGRLGDRLVADARRGPSGCSWHSPSLRARSGLLGISHGASGAALALFDLWRETGHGAARSAAEQAISYERAWFDTAEGNWPDLRERPKRGAADVSGHCVFWCHGAPGIALVRMQVARWMDDAPCAREAQVALDTTRREIAVYLDGGSGNFSLCHGLAGLGDVLLTARHFAFQDGDDAARIAAIVKAAAELASREDSPWPCGTHGGETPGALLGLAGIGAFALRVAAPAASTMLLPTLWSR